MTRCGLCGKEHGDEDLELAARAQREAAAQNRAEALISWIEGACVDEMPHMEIREAINRYRGRGD